MIFSTVVTWVEMSLHVSRDPCATEAAAVLAGPLDKAGGDVGGDSGAGSPAPVHEGPGSPASCWGTWGKWRNLSELLAPLL